MTLKTITRVQSIEEAVLLLNDPGQTSQVLAGGAGISLALHFGRLQSDRLVDISGVAAVQQVEFVQTGEQQYLKLGAGLSLRQLEKHPLILAKMPYLAGVLRGSGDLARRNAYTLGGRLAERRNTGLLFPALAVLEAELLIADTDGETRQSVMDWFQGSQTKNRHLITAVLIPQEQPAFWQSEEVKRRQMQGELLAGVIISAASLSNGVTQDIRIASFVDGWGVNRWASMEQCLNDQAASDRLFEYAANELIPLLKTRWGTDDDARYRIQVLPELMLRCWQKIWQSARED